MNNLHKYIWALLISLSLTGCIKEVEPMSNMATTDQVKKNPKSAEALLYGIPAYENTIWSSTLHCSFGLGGWMIIRDTETGDVARPGTGYNWFSNFSEVNWIHKITAQAQMRWRIVWEFVQTTNELLRGLPEDPKKMTDSQKGYYAVGKAFRAMIYLDAAQCYWFAPCKTHYSPNIDSGENEEGVDVKNLTIPLITNNTTEKSASNNRRLNKDEMIKFIESELEDAEKYIDFFKNADKIFPHKASVCGLIARLNLWKGDYTKAEEYARKAIKTYLTEEKGSVLTKEQYLDKRNGNNNLEYYMWGSQQTSESQTTKSAIINWTSWMSPETLFGYGGGAGVYPMIDKNMYERIDDKDWRKLVFKPAEGSGLEEKFKRLLINPAMYDKLPTYTSIKFRPKNGENRDHILASATAYPIMRVEEMFFIVAEALAQQDKLAEAKSKLEEFMKTYRYDDYNTKLIKNKEEIIDEIIFQKRVELWGEGRTYFDIKRLDMSVTRGYEGTPHADASRYNTDGRPAWMNWVIVKSEEENNKAIKNNPDPTGAIKLWDPKRD